MLESQRTLDEVDEDSGPRFPGYDLRKDHVSSASITMDVAAAGDSLRGRDESSSRWEQVSVGTHRCCHDFGREIFVQTWRDRPRDLSGTVIMIRRNLVAMLLVLASGIVTWESSVDALRTLIDRTIIFPLYLPHAVALAVACVWTTAAVPGNFVGLYLVRLYMIWRLHLEFTVVNITIMLLVGFLGTVQSHIGAYFLRKFLCSGGTKRIPTIDSVREAVCFLVTVFLLSLTFGTLISLCITLTPLIKWASFWRYWATWWMGALASMITITPLLTHLLAWDYQPNLRSARNLMECAFVAVTTSVTMVLVFFLNFEHFRPLPYLVFPLITWTAFRFSKVGWALTVSVIAYCAAAGSIRKRGSFYTMSSKLAVASPTLIIQIELFSCVMGVVAITIAAAVREKQSLTRKLHQLNVELEETVETRTAELRKANEELQISQKKAEQASHAKSDFLANMSHEIRTPIHGILGLTALLLESELTPDQEESLVSVKECADLLLHIINSVLDLAKIEAGRLEVEKVPFNIRKMVSSTFRMLQPRAQQRGLQLLWEVDKNVPQTMVGDVGKLQQCLMNLVGNALKFTHKGSVSVAVRLVAQDATIPDVGSHDELGNIGSGPSSGRKPAETLVTDSTLVQFEVRDTGIGISEEKLQDMFNPFTQADASTSRLYGGTGLGLCIVQRFVELLGGTIWAESEVGKGSTFHFRLPFLNNPKDSPPSEMSPKMTTKYSLNTKYAEKFPARQSWSLMGGLIFTPPSKYHTDPDSPSQPRSATVAPRGRSANDLLELWNDGNTDVHRRPSAAFDSDSSDSPTPGYRGTLLRQRSGGHRTKTSPDRPPPAGGPPGSRHSSLEKTRSDPSGPRQQRHGEEPLRSARSASNEGTLGLAPTLMREPFPLVPTTSSSSSRHHHLVLPSEDAPSTPHLVPFVSVSSQTSSTFSDWDVGTGFLQKPHEGPMDFDTPTGEEAPSGGLGERDRGTSGVTTATAAVATVATAGGDGGSVRSDLSRESSAELENMLHNKVSLNILLAEDNAINQKVASRQLEKHGHVVEIVGDGQRALDVMCKRHDDFDLVLMDVQMPVLDGLRATDLIRKAERENGWTRVPILGLTAHAIQGYQDTCLQHGMDGYLGKPFDIHQLLKTIGHMLPPDTLGHLTLSR